MARVLLTVLLGSVCCLCSPKDESRHIANPDAVKYNNLAVEQQRKLQFDSALFFIEKAIHADSSVYLYHVQRLSFLWALDRNEEALSEAKKISMLRRFNNLSFEGMAYERLGNIVKAKELYKSTVDNWPRKDLDSSYQSRIEYSTFATVVYGKEFGLEEISKIDTSKLTIGEVEIVETMKRTIEQYQGGSYQQLMENINILPSNRRP